MEFLTVIKRVDTTGKKSQWEVGVAYLLRRVAGLLRMGWA